MPSKVVNTYFLGSSYTQYPFIVWEQIDVIFDFKKLMYHKMCA